MLYLIGGPPRCGKTTLSRALATRLHIPWFSIDHIASVIPPYIAPDRQDERFPLRSLRQKLENDNDRFYAVYSPDEIVAVYEQQAATCWPGIRNFINYAIEDEHDLVLEGWQILPRFLAELPTTSDGSKVQTRYLYKSDVEAIVAGLKANDPHNDWVLKNTRDEKSFLRIAQMISCFGEAIRRDAAAAGFPSANTDRDFAQTISQLSDQLVNAWKRSGA